MKSSVLGGDRLLRWGTAATWRHHSTFDLSLSLDNFMAKAALPRIYADPSEINGSSEWRGLRGVMKMIIIFSTEGRASDDRMSL